MDPVRKGVDSEDRVRMESRESWEDWELRPPSLEDSYQLRVIGVINVRSFNGTRDVIAYDSVPRISIISQSKDIRRPVA